ncbi:TPA: hypothetical protein ACSP0J_002520 [Aeromonas veronii]|uniref:hypothetical protein n=1 Tax=Aeromonas TaxID=642 RepID=UPI00111BAF2C|nr:MULTISPECIES: hypothetical protein [Aeromonas]
MSPEILGAIIKYGPIVCGLISFFSLVAINHKKGRKNNLGDLLVVGLAGSSVPTGILLIYGAFDGTVIPKLSDAGIYIAFAGAALLIIFGQTFKEKA